MAFKEVSDLSADITISLGGVSKKTGKKNPTSIEGYYLGNRQVEDKKKKSGISFIYIFQTAKGNVGVWGKTDLDRKMQSAALGTMVRATHVGMTPTPNGEMYKYKVEVDKDNTIEVSAAPSPGAPQPDTYSSDEEPSYSASADEEDNAEENAEIDEVSLEEAQRVLAAAAAERKAKVQALLGKSKKA